MPRFTICVPGAAARRAREEAERRAREEAKRRERKNLIVNLARWVMLLLNIVLMLVREHVFWGAGPGCHR
jgi:hypothetical protein